MLPQKSCFCFTVTYSRALEHPWTETINLKHDFEKNLSLRKLHAQLGDLLPFLPNTEEGSVSPKWFLKISGINLISRNKLDSSSLTKPSLMLLPRVSFLAAKVSNVFLSGY